MIIDIQKTIGLSLAVLFSLTFSVNAERVLSRSDILDKAEGMWLGQIVANMAGRETEGVFKGSVANPADSVPWVLNGPDTYWPGDDDTDMEYIALHILETHGLNPTPAEISSQWLNHITSNGIYISNRQAWYLMGDGFLPPLTGSRNYNEHWYSIDSQITTEVLGTISPGMTQQAIDLAKTFASVSNEGFPVHATEFQAAMYSNCWFESDIITLVTQAMAAIPESSRSYKVVSDVLGWYQEDLLDGVLDWRATRKKLYDYYGGGAFANGRYYNWIESTVNLGATVLCLLYGQGDYAQTVQIGILAGWDCDCNPAIAGGILGVINGRSGLPQELFAAEVCSYIYKNIYRPYLPDHNVTGAQYDSITNIVESIADLIESNIVANGGSVEIVEGQKYYTIADNELPLIIESEKYDPSGPAGLVKLAADSGIAATPFAAVEYFNSANDLNNLNQIIDGIVDNSYNGVRPYRSYSSATIGKQQDYYGIEFSAPVVFESVTFYEGDIAWSGINYDYSIDVRKGGYFENLTVEVMIDGIFAPVVSPVFSEPLDPNKYYQVINISFEPIKGTAVRIIGTPGGTQSFTSILELEAHGYLYTADFDNNGQVDMHDFADFTAAYLSTSGSEPYSALYDLDSSGSIDLYDCQLLIRQWLK